ncbi:hypothetical protein CDAR_514181 [Caerostris darwini]|uniref:Uncharacterized protein n=1 Tax=Caerostris darwini TaxID=1538125 RepID=A0AAV4UN81_9ARAC|nr:hypothetical protein CDAR_514181 [Caerostris darwini]
MCTAGKKQDGKSNRIAPLETKMTMKRSECVALTSRKTSCLSKDNDGFRKCFDKHGNYQLSVEGFEGRKYVLTKRHFRWKEPVRWMGAKYPFKRFGIEKEYLFVGVLC